MIEHLSSKGMRLAILGAASFIVTFVGIEMLAPRSAMLQNMLHISKGGGRVLATDAPLCTYTHKDLKNEVFFVSCGGFF